MKRLFLVVSLALTLVPALAQNHKDYTLPEVPKRAQYIDFESLDKGLWFAVQATPILFIGNGFGAQADIVAGYRTGEWFRLGAGISPGFASGSFSLPVYLDLRGNLITQESRMAVPYWSLDAGYNFGRDFKGIYASPTVGVRVGGPRNDFIAGVTYILQFVQDPWSYASVTPLHAIGLRLGFEF